MKKIDHCNIFLMILWWMALHLFIVGIGLIVMPPQLMEFLLSDNPG